MTSAHLQTLLTHIAVWAGVAAPVAFAIQYTWLSRWWRNPTGVAIMALDFCVWLSFVVGVIDMLEPDLVSDDATMFGWLRAGIVMSIPLIISYRMLHFEAKRRRLGRRDRVMLVPSPRRNGGDGSRAHHRRAGDYEAS